MVSKGLGEAEVELVEISQVSLESTNIENEDKESDFHFCSQMATVSTDMAIICNYRVKNLVVNCSWNVYYCLEYELCEFEKSFEQIWTSFEQIWVPFEQILARFERISSKFERILGEFEQILSEFGQIWANVLKILVNGNWWV